MKKRNYQQFCPLAFALDLIGDRWTLLIVRELSLGPRRYSDIQRGLKGIGPNLLSDRLKDLESNAIVEHVFLPPPANSSAYGLTQNGLELFEAIGPIAMWGSRYLPPNPPEEMMVSTIALMGGVQLMYAPANDELFSAEIQLLPDIFTLTNATGQLQVAQGKASSPTLIIQSTTKPLMGVLSHALPLEKALESGALTLIQGEMSTLEKFVDNFRAPFD